MLRQLTDLDDLALDHLKAVFPRKQAKKYLKTGIPDSSRGELKGDEVELLGRLDDAGASKLLYVGRRTISKYGCCGCHDIPGFEDAKPIGTGLADWGRKGADKLAFEQIGAYLPKVTAHRHMVPTSTVTLISRSAHGRRQRPRRQSVQQ